MEMEAGDQAPAAHEGDERERGPQPAQALTLILVILGLLLTAGVAAQRLAVYPGLLFTEVALLLVPVVVFCRLQGWAPGRVLLLSGGRPVPMAGAAGIGLLAFAMALCLTFPVLMLMFLAGGRYPGIALPLDTTAAYLQALLVGAVAAPICEEILFRGFLLRALAPYGPHVAVWLSAAVFGVFHMDPVRFVSTLALGVVYGYLAAGSGSVKAPITAHAVNNGLALTLAFLGGGGESRAESLDLEGIRRELESSLGGAGAGLPAGVSTELLLAAAAGMLLLAGLVLAVLARLAVRGLAAPGPGRFTRFAPVPAPGRRRPGDLAATPALWGIVAIGLVVWSLSLWGIFAGG